MKNLVQLLQKNNVTDICFCSGARNAPLLPDLQKYFNVHFFIDERIAAFTALGMAKGTKNPTVICTTSGTALAECYPAIIESYYKKIPLIVMSADRPLRLRGTGAPQTIIQKNFFGTYVRDHRDGPLQHLEKEKSLTYPAHLNVCLDDAKRPTHKQNINLVGPEDLADFLKDHNPLVLISDGLEDEPQPQHVQKLITLLLNNNYYVYAENLSHLSKKTFYPRLIRHEKTLHQLIQAKKVHSVLRLGHTPLGSFFRDLDRKYDHIEVFHWDDRSLPAMAWGKLLTSSYKKYWDHFLTMVQQNKKNNPLESFEKYSLIPLIEKFPRSEISFFHELSQKLPSHSTIYLGNSMPIRYWNMVSEKAFDLYSNRGVNGIDGQISTAIGLSKTIKKNIYAILGDQTCLYDLSALISPIPQNLKLIVINNFGGRIFEQLGLSGKILQEHSQSLCHLTEGFPLKSKKIFSPAEITLQHDLLEIIPCHEQTQAFWQRWKKDS